MCKAMSASSTGSPGRGSSPIGETTRRWAMLAGCLLALWGFIFVVGPGLRNLEAFRPLAAFIEEHGIDAGALYYTEVEEVGPSETSIRNSLAYPPSRTGRGK